MIGFEEAQARLCALAVPVDVEALALPLASGRWLAEPVTAKRTQPAHDLSAMDGYAIRVADAPGPWQMTGTSAAGAPFGGAVSVGEAVRIFTGAYLPEGADAILIQEHAERDGTRLILTNMAPAAGNSIRRRGEDFEAGRTLVEAGERLTAARLALAAVAGLDHVAVRRRVRVVIASTGDELVPLGSDNGLPDSNGPMLASLIGDLPVEVTAFGIVRDTAAELDAFFAAARHHDVIVTTGGASVGDHDLVRPALLAAGAELDFWKVAMRPGKPIMAGRLGDALVLGLPGNPVSAFVTAHLFLRPLIARLSGAVDPLPKRVTVRLGCPLPGVGERTDFVRMRWQDGALITALPGDSGALLPLAQAEALAIRPAGTPPAQAGDLAEALLLA